MTGKNRATPGTMLRTRLRSGLGVVVLIFAMSGLLMARYGGDLAFALESRQPSRSIGTPENGRLDHGKRLPRRGSNFRVYSDLGALLGRNAVHDPVRQTIIDAYAALQQQRPASRYVYGETGWPQGGPFAPHKTHQNGMAVDFFVPVLDITGQPCFLPTGALQLFGYGIEFDDTGHWNRYQIDFEAMAAHLDALDTAARSHGLRIELVIFDQTLQTRLFASTHGHRLRERLRFSRRPPWIRHDEHYHVVFTTIR